MLLVLVKAHQMLLLILEMVVALEIQQVVMVGQAE
jgi:hypothetical protein